MELIKKEKDLIIKVLTQYEEEVFRDIDKKENDFIFNLIDKLTKLEVEE